MVIGNRTKRRYSLRMHSRIFSRHNHGKTSGLGRMDATSMLFARKDWQPTAQRMRRGHRVVDPDRAAKNFGGCSALALMTKAPRAGQVKTRLVPPLTNEEAAQLNRCFLRDTGAAISAYCSSLIAPSPSRPIVRGVAVYTPVGSES